MRAGRSGGKGGGRGGIRSRAGAWAGLLAAAGALATAGPAMADACSDCGPPPLAQLQQQPGFTLADRPSFLGSSRDYYQVDGGECRLSLDSQPKVTKRSEWVAASMFGEAINCPEGKMVSRIRLALQHTEQYEWHLNSSSGAEIDVPLLAKLKAAVEGGVGGGAGSGVVAEIDQMVEPAYCHRLRWCAYFLVGDFGATAPWTLERRFAWWTKNSTTGGSVHASGQFWVKCDGGTGSMSRWAPISSHVSLYDRACTNCLITVSGYMGWFPPLPEPLQPFDPLTKESDEGAIPEGPALPPALPPSDQPPLGPDGKEPVDPNAPPIDPNAPPALPPAPGSEDPPPAPPPEPNPMDPMGNGSLGAAPARATDHHHPEGALTALKTRASCA